MKLKSFRPILEQGSAPLVRRPAAQPPDGASHGKSAPENGFLTMGATLPAEVGITHVVSPFPLHRLTIPGSRST
jgi:hypothetical protein